MLKVLEKETKEMREIYHCIADFYAAMANDVIKHGCSDEVLEFIKNEYFITIQKEKATPNSPEYFTLVSYPISIDIFDKSIIKYTYVPINDDEDDLTDVNDECWRVESLEEFHKFIDTIVVTKHNMREYEDANMPMKFVPFEP